MSIGSSQLPTPAEPPEVHDIGIVSVSDDQDTVNAAVGLEPEAKPKTPPAEETPPAEAGEVTPPVEAPPETPPAEETPPVEAAGEETPPVEEPPAESAAIQKRFNSFAATVANRDQHIKILTQRLDAMERRQAPPVEEKPTVTEPTAFTFQSFEAYQEAHPDSTYEQYIDERTDAKYDHRQQADVAKRRDDDARATHDTAAANAQAVLAENATRMTEFEAQHPTFTESLKASTSPMTAVMEETMMRSAIGPALAMYVADHPEEATRISQIPDTFAQAIEIVRLEAHPDVVALAEKAWPDGEPAAVVPVTAPRSGAGSPPVSAGGVTPTIKPRRAAPPAPMTPARGTAGKARDLSDMTETEDADEYIRESDRDARERGQRR